jgi:hypothetical protein
MIALNDAIQDRESLIDCHRTEWAKTGLEKVIPKRYLRDVKAWEKMIAKYKELQRRLSRYLSGAGAVKAGKH